MMWTFLFAELIAVEAWAKGPALVSQVGQR